MTELTGRVVLITGAGKGAGRLLARALAERGATVAANDISPINVEQVVDEIHAQGGQARAYIEDVAKKLGAQYLINQVEEDFGRIDILINHASVEPHVPLLEIDEWDWHRVLDVNLTGAFLMTQSVGRLMRAQGRGMIINLIAAGKPESETGAAFAATMSGLEGFSRQAAFELSPYGIAVHAMESNNTIVDRVLALLDRRKGQAMKELLEYRAKLIARLVEAAQEFRRECLALPDVTMPLEAGGWTVHQIAAHTRDVHQLVYGPRARRTAAEDNPEFQNFNGEEYMVEHYSKSESLAKILDELVEQVESLAEELGALPPKAWARVSSHVMLGRDLTLQTWVEKDLAHIEEHLEAVRSWKSERMG